jgi:Ca-activated chloride channel family protein
MQRPVSLRTVRIVALIALAVPLSQCTTETQTPQAEFEWSDGPMYARQLEALGHLAQFEPSDREQYGEIEENPFIAVSASPRSTFSIDVDRASYSNVRRFLAEGKAPPRDAVRIEELVNYFPYDYAEPDGSAPLALAAEVGQAPWRTQHRLVRIGLQARRVALGQAPPASFVFLIDVSGSMQDANKLPLLQRAFGLLVEQLRPQDRVAIVVYAGAAGLVLPSTPGTEKARILEAIQGLEAGGSTAGGAGIRLAYAEAARHLVPGGNNRLILATDGDFNVGASSDAEMVRLIEEKRASGVFLTVLGFGEGNLQDAKMQKLAQHGNGNYAYIDSLLEARKVLVHEMGGTLLTCCATRTSATTRRTRATSDPGIR